MAGMADNVDRTPNAFERFEQRIAQVPMAKIDALEAAGKARRVSRSDPKPKRRPAAERPG